MPVGWWTRTSAPQMDRLTPFSCPFHPLQNKSTLSPIRWQIYIWFCRVVVAFFRQPFALVEAHGYARLTIIFVRETVRPYRLTDNRLKRVKSLEHRRKPLIPLSTWQSKRLESALCTDKMALIKLCPISMLFVNLTPPASHTCTFMILICSQNTHTSTPSI